MPWRSQARVHVRREQDALVVTASGEFDADEQDLLPAAWSEVDERALSITVLDLSGVTFADSSFLDALLRGRVLHRGAGRRLVLVGPLHPRVITLLTVTQVLEHFEIADSVAQALGGEPLPDGTAAM
ncbi:STAS domain-containing protein [Streptomyces microflavus]|uniref:STAS domain-containing protein n=1 Tax=Streptomyces microflavus TaxID=1919 RepID=A0A7H8MK75_STRMI|nr:STAS domain-containing protein [Streptomyces microflavus]QKW42889.1 STAS domain-containing protein [Streptomyces microflavus]